MGSTSSHTYLMYEFNTNFYDVREYVYNTIYYGDIVRNDMFLGQNLDSPHTQLNCSSNNLT